MLTSQKSQAPIKAKLLVDMIVEGEPHSAGEVVELSSREFKYLSHYGRVEVAPAPPAKGAK